MNNKLLTLLAAASPAAVLAQAGTDPAQTAAKTASDAKPPANIILIVADDLGYSDLSCYGNANVHTPNIDRLAAEGVRFTQGYCSSPISGPSRAGLLTGRCQNRFGCEFMPYDHFDTDFMRYYKRYYFSHYLLPPLVRRKPEGLKDFSPKLLVRRNKHATDLPQSEITLGQLLRREGYTTGLVGKWNMGTGETASPAHHGFDYSYYFSGALTRYVDDPVDTARYVSVHLPWAFSELPAWQRRAGPTAIRDNGGEVTDTGYLTFSFAEKAVAFIERSSDKPFFLTLTFNAPHDPFQAPRAYWDRIEEADPVKRIYYAMIEALDDAVGDVLSALKRNDLYDDTLIVFTSDNGGAAYTRATDNAPLTGGKCSMFEGGLRVPFMIKFAGRNTAAGTVYDKPVTLLDIFATAAAAAGAQLPEDRRYDGYDLRPYVENSDRTPHNALFWRNGYVKACIVDGWKLYISEKAPKLQLYNLNTDPEENVELSADNPAKVEELRALLEEWEQTQTVEPLWPSSGDFIQRIRGQKVRFPV